jgi:hypothetical protein
MKELIQFKILKIYSMNKIMKTKNFKKLMINIKILLINME